MRNLRKILAVVVVVAFIAMSSIVPAFADTALSASTQTCADIGMLLGTGSGVTADYAASTPTRIQAAVLFLRLKGLEADAKAFTGTDNFADSSKASWAAPYMAYLKANPALGWVGDGTNFNPTANISAQEYYKVILTALGYVQGTDFQYADTLTFAQNTAKLAMAGNVANFTIDSVAAATVEGLKAAVKGGTDTLAATLVAAGKIDAAKAAADGLVSATPAELSATAAATGAKKLTVTFNQAVADTTKATFAVTRDGAAVTVSATNWSADKTSVDLVPNANLIAGNYTITVKGLTATDMTLNVNGVKDQAVTKLQLNSDKLAVGSVGISHTATITYKAFNQYGEDVTSSAVTPNITWTSSLGTASGDGQGTVTITYGDTQNQTTIYFTVGQTVVLTGVITDPSAAGVSVTSTLTVGQPSSVDSVTFDKIYNVDGSTLATDSTFSNFYLLFSAKDQYGNDMAKGHAAVNQADTSTAGCNTDLYVYSSNPSVVDVNQQLVNGSSVQNPVLEKQGPNANELAIQFKAPSVAIDGTASITMVSKSTGKTFTFQVTSAKASAVQKLTLQAPGTTVASGETGIAIPFTALDQTGAAVTDFGKLSGATNLSPSGPTATTGKLYWAHDYVAGVAVLKFDAPTVTTDTPITLMAVTTNGSGVVAQVTITVKAAAYPSTVGSLTSDVSPNLTINASTAIEGDYINVLDQFGRAYDLSSPPVGASKYGDDITGTIVSFSQDEVNTGMKANLAAQDVAVGTKGLYRLVVKLDSGAIGAVELGVSAGTPVQLTNKVAYALYADADKVSVKADALGTQAVDVVLQQAVVLKDNANNPYVAYQDVSGSSYTQNFVVNKKANYTSYTVGDIATTYDLGVATNDPNPANKQYANADATLNGSIGNYTPQVAVYGIVNGTKYALDPSDFSVTCDNSNVVITADNHIFVELPTTAYTNGATTTTANLVVTIFADSNPVVVTKTLNISNSDPSAATVALDSGYTADGTYNGNAIATFGLSASAYDNASEIGITGIYNSAADPDNYSGLTVENLRAVLDKAVKVTDQYGQQEPAAYLHLSSAVRVSNLPTDTVNNVSVERVLEGARKLDGSIAGAGTTNLVAGDTFSVTYVVNGKYYMFKVVCN